MANVNKQKQDGKCNFVKYKSKKDDLCNFCKQKNHDKELQKVKL